MFSKTESHCVTPLLSALTSVSAHLTLSKDKMMGSNFPVLSPSLENKLQEGRNLCDFWLLLYTQNLDQCLAHYRCSINMQWINEWVFKLKWSKTDIRYDKLCISKDVSSTSIQIFSEAPRRVAGSSCFPHCKYNYAILWT